MYLVKIMREIRSSGARRYGTLLIFLCLAGCAVTLVSKYDEIIDHGITDFQRKIDLYLIQKQKNPVPAYRESFYDSVFTDLGILATRSAAIPKNSITDTIIAGIKSQVQRIKTRDSSGSKSAEFFQIMNVTIDRDCKSALTFELAKKRGD